MKNISFACLGVAALCASLAAQDFSVIEKIRAEGMERSKVLETFDYLTTTIGPRLTNSPAHKRAIVWMQEQMKALGLSEVHAENFQFGRGWTLNKLSIEMVEPRYMPLTGYPRGWSPSTPGRVVATPIWMPGLEDAAMKAQAGKLKGAILFTSPIQEYAIRADRPAASGDLKPPSPAPTNRPPNLNAERLAPLKAEGVAVTIEPNIGEHGTVFVTGRDMGVNAVPSIILASEHYNLIAKMLQQKIPVKLAIEIQATFNEEDRNTQNVIAEIAGADNAVKDEIVMVGAHLDSWHTATGATDNADGAATVMEAMRILKTLNVRPRRTIRAALWAGEEQGLLGSKAYVEQHLAGDKNKVARDKFSVYFNLDNGYPPISGFYMEGNEPARAIMTEWLKPVSNMGAIMPSPGHIGATDHLSFLDVGVPGFQAVQDYVNYDVRTHHTNADFAERIEPNALKQAATVMAVVLYQASMREGTFPKPAPPKPAATKQ
ncbi:MAG TPA: M20/M25/M40 family metallo-hydrolase [Vicinamibacterales bacterium]